MKSGAVRGRAEDAGRSPYGERGLKFRWPKVIRAGQGRSPYGERGLKCNGRDPAFAADSRSPYGERGLKFDDFAAAAIADGRSPYGERGLKFKASRVVELVNESLSLRRAWIEIRIAELTRRPTEVALLTESVD